ncbi:hypothetical protein A7982_12542 [Minicystis rosea]|nr:hypothetical protein A7982_12542 [Minicystis rosea]
MFANTQMAGLDFAFPDVLLTPMPAPVPVPYPNNGQGSMGAPPVSNVLIMSMPAHNMATKVPLTDGANPGVAGVVSGTVRGPTRPVTGVSSILLNGMPATRMTDTSRQNGMNATGTRITPSQTKVQLLAT